MVWSDCGGGSACEHQADCSWTILSGSFGLYFMWCPCILLKKCVEIYGINAILNVLYKSFNLLTDAFGSSLDYSGYRDSWEQWSHELHCRKAFLANAGATKKDWELIEHEIGACYFDIVRCHLVDPMHNHLLGTAESMMTIWMESGLQCFENIQKQAGLVNLPAGIGRIPGKIASSWLFRLYCWTVENVNNCFVSVCSLTFYLRSIICYGVCLPKHILFCVVHTSMYHIFNKLMICS